MFRSAMPARFKVAKTAFIAFEFCAKAAAAVGALLTTPADSVASSGAALASPWPETVRTRDGASAASAMAGLVNRTTAIIAAVWKLIFDTEMPMENSSRWKPKIIPACGEKTARPWSILGPDGLPPLPLGRIAL